MNFVLRRAHAEEKKKGGGHTNPDVHTIYNNIYIEIADVPSMWVKPVEFPAEILNNMSQHFLREGMSFTSLSTICK